jgi:hypothetical protein
MSAKFDIKNYSAAELALLGIFALGLLLASVVVSHRNKIRLSGPIELKRSGLSASLPVGGGWQASQSWIVDQQREMSTLTGQLLVGTSMGAVVQWRFMGASGRLMPEDRLSIRVGTDEVEIVDAGQIQTDDAVMDWVQGRLQGRLEDVFLGIARVRRGWIVELEVVTPGDAELAERIFRAVAASLRYGADSLSHERAASRLRRVALLGANGIECVGPRGPQEDWRRI